MIQYKYKHPIASNADSYFNSLDLEDQRHALRVTELSLKIAYALNQKVDFMLLEKASKYHDLGKLRINPMILSKTAPLNDFERKEIMSHAKHSGRILLEVGENKRVIEIAMLHHENYDGTGYPFRLKKGEIPLEARIIRVADVFDALRSERAYKKGFTVEKCKEIMIKEQSYYDPEILKALMSIL